MRRICQQVIYPLKDIYPQSGITVVSCKLLQKKHYCQNVEGVSHDVGFLFQDQWMMSELSSSWNWQEWSVHSFEMIFFHIKRLFGYETVWNWNSWWSRVNVVCCSPICWRGQVGWMKKWTGNGRRNTPKNKRNYYLAGIFLKLWPGVAPDDGISRKFLEKCCFLLKWNY